MGQPGARGIWCFFLRFPDILTGMDVDEMTDSSGPVEVPVDGTLDLHTFNPREVKELLPHYLDACRELGIHQVRVIHGKGTGMLRETVHSLLRKLSGIDSFKLADENSGGWGATIVILAPRPPEQKSDNILETAS